MKIHLKIFGLSVLIYIGFIIAWIADKQGNALAHYIAYFPAWLLLYHVCILALTNPNKDNL